MKQRMIVQFVDECGCSVNGTDDKDGSFSRCKLHAAAPALLEALEELFNADLGPDTLRILQPWFAKIEPIIEAAQ